MVGRVLTLAALSALGSGCRGDASLPPACRGAYAHYGCSSCHGSTGHGVADLRGSAAHMATDRDIEAWIRHPNRVRPGVAMPDFDRVVREDDYPELIRCVRTLAPRDR